MNTQSNPTGRLIPRSWIEALVEWAAGEDLWIIADEVYEDYVFFDIADFLDETGLRPSDSWLSNR